MPGGCRHPPGQGPQAGPHLEDLIVRRKVEALHDASGYRFRNKEILAQFSVRGQAMQAAYGNNFLSIHHTFSSNFIHRTDRSCMNAGIRISMKE